MMMDGYQTDIYLKQFEDLFGKDGSIWSDSKTDTTTAGPSKSETINPPKMTGWICPVCGRGLSPWTSACPCKGGKGWEVTC